MVCIALIASCDSARRSCVSYAADSDWLLVSSLDSVHRLHSCHDVTGSPLDGSGLTTRAYAGHVNKKYSVFSAVGRVCGAEVVLSGSEDNKVCTLLVACCIP